MRCPSIGYGLKYGPLTGSGYPQRAYPHFDLILYGLELA
jgi:hypothetical protein